MHPYRSVTLAGGFNTRQALLLEGTDSLSVTVEAALGALEATGIDPPEVDRVYGTHAQSLIYLLGLRYASGASVTDRGSTVLLDAVNAVAAGVATVALIAGGAAGVHPDHTSTAPWTRPENELVAPFGLYTAVEFALIARRHMNMYGTTPEQIAGVAAKTRNNGSVNPEAVYFGRGPYTAEDVLLSRMIADPFHLLDCAMTAEGGTALVVVSADRAKDLPTKPVHVLGVGQDHFGPLYQYPPAWDCGTDIGREPLGRAGSAAAAAAFRMCGLRPSDIDVFEPYDAFSFEVIRQLEAFGFCDAGEGGPMVESLDFSASGALPISTDGGLLSFSHCVWGQQLQRIVRGVHQIQGSCASNQVDSVEVALCSVGGAGALYTDVILLGSSAP